MDGRGWGLQYRTILVTHIYIKNLIEMENCTEAFNEDFALLFFHVRAANR